MTCVTSTAAGNKEFAMLLKRPGHFHVKLDEIFVHTCLNWNDTENISMALAQRQHA